MKQPTTKHRGHPLYWAFLLHRLSGLTLALFLPAHFWVLSLALTDPESMDGFLAFAEAPLVKASEIGLVFLIAAHALGGLRLLVLELTPWSNGWTGQQKTLAAGVIVGAILIALLFMLQVI